MEDTGKQKFEENWREAVGSANVAPPEKVWTDIEQRLGHDSMKTRVIFYQHLAAASILFAFLAGAFGLYWRDQHNTQLAAIKNSEVKSQEGKQNPVNSKGEVSKVEASKSDSSNLKVKVAQRSGIASNNTKLVNEYPLKRRSVKELSLIHI